MPSAMDVARLAAMDAERAAGLLKEIRAATLAGRRAGPPPRAVINESWIRAVRDGLDPEQCCVGDLLSLEELAERRQRSPLAEVLPLVRESLAPVTDEAQSIMAICDAEGRVLWREGHPAVLRKADLLGFEPGADWSERAVGTNGVGTPLVIRRPVRVHSAEHFVRAQHPWTCAGAPITDPRDGRLLGGIDVSGPHETQHPATQALVASVAKLAEAWLRERHLTGLDRLRSVAAPVLARVGGRALAVDRDGWTAGVTGMPPVDRVALPRGLAQGRAWLPSLGDCRVEMLPGGWLLRIEEPREAAATRVFLDVSGTRRSFVTVSGGAGDWTHELTPRHAELLYLLAVHRPGRSASELAEALFGDPGRTVTVRAEVSRIRRYLGGLLEHRPYRFREDAVVEVARPERGCDLLPHSSAPSIRGGPEAG
ncbi:helix-turn-helix domain-containing protein [Streptomyces uncialis]|nr:helix-turn-helix domain-containing protein [Streptomyces uncialis]MCX4659458.1 GAF domain-containing protein [Streptomyces uncialis]WST67543.1 GAF domain-containing protein [Streptomyces uncialis]WTE13771.1 GAF domain-containing protein [Streptomyces uncialis]